MQDFQSWLRKSSSLGVRLLGWGDSRSFFLPSPLPWLVLLGVRGRGCCLISCQFVSPLYICCRCSVAQLCPTLCNPMDCSTPGLPGPHCWLEFAEVHVLCISDAIQPSHPLTPLLLLPSIFPSIRDFSSELSVCIRWPNYWGFSFSISPSSEYSWLISLKTDWFDLLAVQGTFRSLLQNHSSKALVLWHSAFFMVQFSQPYMTTGKTIALTIGILVAG